MNSSVLTRRSFLLATSSIVTGCAVGSRRPAAALSEEITLPQFMMISRVLTGVETLRDESSGRQYLEALQPQAHLLSALWEIGGFGKETPPRTVADLAARGVYQIGELAELADTITNNWYSGTYVDAADEWQVATYTNALAWGTLSYRQAGPTACGGVFGHWAEEPV